MKCYKCGSFLYDGEFCSNCGADVTVYREIVLKSNDFYNSALEFARDRNLSKAVEHLKLSLKLYRGNINAHNLLGLVYFETGEYTLGFAHWVISKNLQPENNLASKFLDQIQDDKSYFESIGENIKKYNKAIAYLDQESYDLAEIQLRKLLNDPNVHMVSAFQLSALLRMRKKKYAAARKILERAQAIDAGNPTTISYMTFVKEQIEDEEKDLTAGELKNKRQQESAEGDQHTPLSGDDVIIPKTGFKDYNPATMAIIQILIGFLVGAALIFFVVVPAKTNAVRNEVSGDQSQLEAQIQQLMEENAQLSADLAGAKAAGYVSAAGNNTGAAGNDGNGNGTNGPGGEDGNGSASADGTGDAGTNNIGNGAADGTGTGGNGQGGANGSNAGTPANTGTGDTATTRDEELLLEAYEQYQAGDISGCGSTLYEIQNPDAFTGANKLMYDSISYTIVSASDYWYNDAMELFRADNFEDALEGFQKVYQVANTTGESLYYMGLCYYNLNMNEQAASCFREYIETFPAGAHVYECEYLLEQL